MQNVVSTMVPAVQLAAVKDQLKQAGGEIQRLKKSLDSSVASSLLDEANDQNKRLADELERARQRVQDMVPKDTAERSRAEIDGLSARVKQLQQLLDTSTASEQALQAELAQAKAEIQRLQSNLQTTVPRAQYDAAVDEVASKQKDVDRLVILQSTLVSRNELTAAEDEIKRLLAEVERLKSLLVARQIDIDELRNEVKDVRDDLDKKAKELLGCAPRELILEAQSEAAKEKFAAEERGYQIVNLQEQLSSLTLKLESLVPKDDLLAAQQEAFKIKGMLDALVQQLASAGLDDRDILRRLLDALKDSTGGILPLCCLLEKIKGPPGLLVSELNNLVDLVLSSKSVFLSDLVDLVQDLSAPNARSVHDVRSIVHIMNQPAALSK